MPRMFDLQIKDLKDVFYTKYLDLIRITLPETNIIAPQNAWLEYLFPFGMAHFQGQR